MKPHITSFIRLLRKILTPRRSLRITKTGWKFIGLTLIVGVAAINTANNLLYLVFSVMLSFIVASGMLSELMLRHISLTRTFPKHIFAQNPALVTISLTNRKWFISSYSLLIEDFTRNSAIEHPAYVLKIPARLTVTITYPLMFARRGLHRPGKVRLSTRYPFGLFHKSATFTETEETILVYPEIQQLHSSDLAETSGHAGEFDSPKKGHGLEVHGIREYIPGDSSGRIHWKSTAKLARLMTKEFHDDQRQRVSLILDVSLPGKKTMPPTFLEDVEQAVSLTASYVAHFVKRDFQIQLITPESQTPFDSGQRHLFSLLRTLALFQPKNGHSRQGLSKTLQRLDRTGVRKILISVEKQQRIEH
jgi:uncharacterized protein (DUF58 family)